MTTRAWGALAGLAVILGTTAAWWALALVPLDPTAPEWLARTREVCFGASRDGLPHAGGWLLLIGEPLGMLAALTIGWRDALREGLSGLSRRWVGRIALAAVALAMLAGGAAAADRVSTLRDNTFDPTAGDDPAAIVAAGRMDRAAPRLDLVDQRGDTVRTAAFRGAPLLVAFAYAHCTTVCPVIVRDLLEARRRLGDKAPPLLIVTLDPWRDTPLRLPAIAAEWGLDDGARVLSGSVEQVELVLTAWQVPRSRNVATGDLIHPAIAYVVSPSGRVTHLVDGSLEATLLALKE
jgi:cytochrome oxidase Cu insertion factor (SCO1/SenC/PrrC family)